VAGDDQSPHRVTRQTTAHPVADSPTQTRSD
jgi:hypothetical protein